MRGLNKGNIEYREQPRYTNKLRVFVKIFLNKLMRNEIIGNHFVKFLILRSVKKFIFDDDLYICHVLCFV